MKTNTQKQTDLDAVKNMALIFLEMDITETEFSPLIVMHPIFESAQFTEQVGNEFVFVNVLEDDEALKRIRDRYAKLIKNAKTLIDVYAIIRKSYRLTFLKYVKEFLSASDFAEFLAEAWVSSENPNGDVNVNLHTLVKWFRQAEKSCLMDGEDYKIYCELPDTFRVYRGVAVGRNSKGLSWTQNLSTAEWFSKRFDTDNEKGYIQTAIVNKVDALAYFNTRGEDEVVVDSFKLIIKTL